MISSVWSSNILLCSLPYERTHSAYDGVREVSCSDQAVDLASRPSDCPNYEWVDPRILHIPTCFRGSSALDGFLYKMSILKLDFPSDVVAADSLNHTDWVCHGQENAS